MIYIFHTYSKNQIYIYIYASHTINIVLYIEFAGVQILFHHFRKKLYIISLLIKR